MSTTTWSFPERRGYVVVHQHEEGERCRRRAWSCRYVPTLLTRLRWKLAR